MAPEDGPGPDDEPLLDGEAPALRSSIPRMSAQAVVESKRSPTSCRSMFMAG